MEEKKADNYINKEKIKKIDNELEKEKNKFNDLDELEEIIISLNNNINKCIELISKSIKGNNINKRLSAIETENRISFKNNINNIDIERKEIKNNILNLNDEKDKIIENNKNDGGKKDDN